MEESGFILEFGLRGLSLGLRGPLGGQASLDLEWDEEPSGNFSYQNGGFNIGFGFGDQPELPTLDLFA